MRPDRPGQPDRPERGPALPRPVGKLRRPYRSAATLDALVMRLLRQSKGPLTAYEIAQRANDLDSPISPAQAYRVLDRLMEADKVQRVELLSAYLPSTGKQHGFLVCRHCRSVRPFAIPFLQETIQRLCRTAVFRPARTIVESWGSCSDCERERLQISKKE